MSEELLPQPPVELFDLAFGYQKSKTLFALVELKIPTLLAEGGLRLDEIAARCGLARLAADRFLNACVALKLLARDGDHYSNTQLSQTFLVEDGRAYLGEQFLNYDRTSYPNWANLTARLREWRPGETDDETPQTEDQGAEAMATQHNLALLVGNALARAYDFSRHRKMLDLGGGTGAMSIGVCKVYERLHSIVFDLPRIVRVARRFIEDAELKARIETAAGNFKEDELPEGFDLALLANLLSVAREETNRNLLKRIYERLPAGGAILLSGWILDDARTSPLIPVLFCLEDIAWQAPDVERSFATYERWLADAGFQRIERATYCPPTSLIIGRKE